MNIHIKYGTKTIEWLKLAELIRISPLGTRDPERLRIAVENSFVVCSAFDSGEIVGFGRALSDGAYQSALYDIVVSPDYQNKGVGTLIIESLLKQLPENASTIIYAAPGKQRFYEKHGFRNLKTGMGLFPDPETSAANGYLL